MRTKISRAPRFRATIVSSLTVSCRIMVRHHNAIGIWMHVDVESKTLVSVSGVRYSGGRFSRESHSHPAAHLATKKR